MLKSKCCACVEGQEDVEVIMARVDEDDLDGVIEFEVILDRSGGKRLGIGVIQDEVTQMLLITQVEAGDHAAAQWNASHPKIRRIDDDDIIVAVNGKRGMLEIVEECREHKELSIILRRLSPHKKFQNHLRTSS
jgi:hypothetical protein